MERHENSTPWACMGWLNQDGASEGPWNEEEKYEEHANVSGYTTRKSKISEGN